jgi:hypothetical protein
VCGQPHLAVLCCLCTCSSKPKQQAPPALLRAGKTLTVIALIATNRPGAVLPRTRLIRLGGPPGAASAASGGGGGGSAAGALPPAKKARKVRPVRG